MMKVFVCNIGRRVTAMHPGICNPRRGAPANEYSWKKCTAKRNGQSPVP